jgi:hypothetical protein
MANLLWLFLNVIIICGSLYDDYRTDQNRLRGPFLGQAVHAIFCVLETLGAIFGSIFLKPSRSRNLLTILPKH